MLEPTSSEDYNEISTDYLWLQNTQETQDQANDLHLEYLLEDKHYFIVSPRDIFFSKPRDEDDHLDWCLMQQKVHTLLSYSHSLSKISHRMSLKYVFIEILRAKVLQKMKWAKNLPLLIG